MLLKRLVAYGVFAALAVAMLVFFVQGLLHGATVHKSACFALSPVKLTGKAPPFELKDLEGKTRSLASLKGKLVLLHFWATWCPPCIEELPSLYRMQSELTDPRFELLTVSTDDSSKIVTDFFKKNKVPALPLLMDSSKQVPKAYGTDKFPETYLIGPDGELRYRFVNKRDWSSPAALACIRSQL